MLCSSAKRSLSVGIGGGPPLQSLGAQPVGGQSEGRRRGSRRPIPRPEPFFGAAPPWASRGRPIRAGAFLEQSVYHMPIVGFQRETVSPISTSDSGGHGLSGLVTKRAQSPFSVRWVTECQTSNSSFGRGGPRFGHRENGGVTTQHTPSPRRRDALRISEDLRCWMCHCTRYSSNRSSKS